MDHAKSLILLLGLCIFSGCVFQTGNVKVDVKKKNSLGHSNSTPKSISSVSVINNQIKVTGTGLAGVTSLKIQNNNLNETFSIESVSATQIIANASHALSIGVGQIFDLILNSAEGAATFPVSFSLENESITAVMLSSMGASPGQILKYNGAAWIPSSISSSQLYIGTWNANTNTPDLNLTTPQAGDYYVVTTAGTQGAVTYAIGDWIISNGTTWSKLSHSSSVVGSFNGRTGLVVPASGDYTWAQINKTSSKLEEIADIDISSRVDQKVLKWDATNSKWIMGNDNTGAGAPGPGSITTTEILDGTIANADLAGSIAQAKITGLTTDLASKLSLTSLSATAPLVYNNTTGGFTINNATALLDGVMSAADKTKLTGLETLPSTDGLLERFSGVLRSSVCADGEVLKWVTLTGWTCSTDTSIDNSKQTTLTNSAGLAGALSDETGTGVAVFGTAPVISSPDIRGELRLSGSTSGYVGFVPAAIAGATTYKLPATQGTAGQVLTTDGVATNATLSWGTPATSSISLVGDIGGSIGANTIGNDKVTSTHLLNGTIVDADINSAANIAITKLGTGAVSTTEFNYLTGVSSSIQTQLAAKEATLPTGASTDYIRGNKTLSVFATDVINSVLSTYTISVAAKPGIANTDTVVGAFNKVQKYISDIDGDYVSKSASTNNTVSGVVTFNTIGSLNIGYTPTNATDAVSKAYVDVLGVWAKGAGGNAGDLYRATGNVGIGTSTPNAKLHVLGSYGSYGAGLPANGGIVSTVGTASDAGVYGLTIASGGKNTTSNLGWFSNLVGVNTYYDQTTDTLKRYTTSGGFTNTQAISMNSDASQVDGNRIGFWTGANADPAERMSITASGNVGIGTTTPSFTFGVKSSSLSTTALFESTNVAAVIGFSDSGTTFRSQIGSSGNDLFLQTNGAERMRVLGTNGNVGIGTTTPNYGISLGTEVTGNSSKNKIAVLESTTGNFFYGLGITNPDAVNSNGDEGLGLWGGTETSVPWNGVTGTQADLFIKRGNGYVGIGTTAPVTKLDVNETTVVSSTLGSIRDIFALYGNAGTGNSRLITRQVRTESGGISHESSRFMIQRKVDASDMGFVAFNGGGTDAGGTSNRGISLGVGTTDYFTMVQNGYVGIGITAPRAKLDVAGTFVGKASTLNATSTIDFSSGNFQYTAANCGAFVLHNMKDGGTYTFVVKGTTSTTCSFTAFSDAGATGLTFHLPPDNSATVAGKHTIYTYIVVDTDVYASWVPGV